MRYVFHIFMDHWYMYAIIEFSPISLLSVDPYLRCFSSPWLQLLQHSRITIWPFCYLPKKTVELR